MKWRWIAAFVSMLYMSVGLVAAVSHDHSGHSLSGHQQCDACSWHHDSQIDVPATTPRVSAPERVFVPQEISNAIVVEVSFGLHPGRGPPRIPQL